LHPGLRVEKRVADRLVADDPTKRFTQYIRKERHAVEILQSRDFNSPAILLGGPVDYDMYNNFRSQLDRSKKFHSENSKNCRFVFLGKAAIYSAGTTFMSFFSIENRYLTRGTRLMIHERKLDKQLHINGPLTTCVATVTAALHEIEASIAIQNEGFENLIRGSKVTMDEVLSRAPGNWYIEANEAKSLGLVAEVL
jgi:hypothetical protein